MDLAKAVAGLTLTAGEQAQVREALLGLLAHEADTTLVRRLAYVVAGLNPAAGDWARMQETLVGLLTHPWEVWELTEMVALLDPFTGDRERRVREALLSRLGHETDPGRSWWLTILKRRGYRSV
jgi:hypothetical protein